MDANKLRPGHKVLVDGQPYVIVTAQLRQQPRLAAKMITKLRNLITGGVQEITYTSGQNIEEADITNAKSKFLYNDGENYIFMDDETFEQYEFSAAQLADQTDLLIPDIDVTVMKFNDSPINVDLPPKIIVTIEDTEPGVKGDSASAKTKPATIETGATVQVPLFVNIGDKIEINTQTREYTQRAS